MTETDKCQFFGVRGDALEKSKGCKKCQRVAVERYDECTQETLKLEATSVIVVGGETRQHVATQRMSSVKPNKAQEAKQAKAPVKEKVKAQGKLPRVTGVIDYCVSLMGQNENPTVIEELIAERYIAAGYPKEIAAQRAHGIYLGQLRERKKNK